MKWSRVENGKEVGACAVQYYPESDCSLKVETVQEVLQGTH